jgi:predicted nucleic acid-binding protein
MIFVDSGAWIALSLPNDRNGSAARAAYSELARGAHGSLVTSNFVLDEAVTFLRMASDAPTAARLARTVLASKNVVVAWIDPGTFEAALQLFEERPDKRWSFTDCTSFAVMRDLGIENAFTFDRNFQEAGFSRVP